MSDEEPLKCGYCEITLREPCIDDAGVKQTYEPLVLPCGHEACTYCLPALKADGRPCPVDNCNAIGLCKPDESEPQALARKHNELEVAKSSLTVLEMRVTLEVDEAAFRSAKSSDKVRAQATQKMADLLGEPFNYRPFTCVRRLHEAFTGERKAIKAAYRDFAWLFDCSAEGVDALLGEQTLYLTTEHCYSVLACARLRYNLLTGRAALCDVTEVPRSSAHICPDGVVAQIDGPSAHVQAGILTTHAWERPDYPAIRSGLDDALKRRATALARTEKKIRDGHADELRELSLTVKSLELDIELLETRVPSSKLLPVESTLVLRDETELVLPTLLVHSGVKVDRLEYAFSVNRRHKWPHLTARLCTSVVVPLNDYSAIMVRPGATRLVRYTGDAMRGEIQPGDESKRIATHGVPFALVVGDMLWTRIGDVFRTFDLQTFLEVKGGPPVPPHVEYDLSRIAVIADMQHIRLRVLIAATVRSCISVQGSVLY